MEISRSNVMMVAVKPREIRNSQTQGAQDFGEKAETRQASNKMAKMKIRKPDFMFVFVAIVSLGVVLTMKAQAGSSTHVPKTGAAVTMTQTSNVSIAHNKAR